MRPDHIQGDPAARIARWLDLMRTTDKLLLAGLRQKIGPEGDLNAAYQKWYSDHRCDHDIAVERMARAGVPAESDHAR